MIRLTMLNGASQVPDLAKTAGSTAEWKAAFYDLFRVQGDKIAEHWDTIETIPPQAEWKNTNGKF